MIRLQADSWNTLLFTFGFLNASLVTTCDWISYVVSAEERLSCSFIMSCGSFFFILHGSLVNDFFCPFPSNMHHIFVCMFFRCNCFQAQTSRMSHKPLWTVSNTLAMARNHCVFSGWSSGTVISWSFVVVQKALRCILLHTSDLTWPYASFRPLLNRD